MLNEGITLGNVLTIVSILVAIFTLAWKGFQVMSENHAENSRRLTELEVKIDAMWDWFVRHLHGGDE